MRKKRIVCCLGSPLAGFGPPVSSCGCCSLSVGCAWRGAAGCPCLSPLGFAVASVSRSARRRSRARGAARLVVLPFSGPCLLPLRPVLPARFRVSRSAPSLSWVREAVGPCGSWLL